MGLPVTKPNAGVVRKILAFFAVAMFSLFSIGLGSSAQVAKLTPNRLDRLNPTEVPPTFAWQPWASLVLKFAALIVMIGGMFAKQEDKLWQRTGKKWVAIAGGIAVFVFTVQVTDFIPTVFG